MTSTKINPFKHEYFLGYINQVLPQFVKIHFPSSVLLNGFTHFGKEFNGGLVGSFVVIEGDKFGFLGRITELILPESERLSLNEKAFQTNDFHPTGKIEILLSFDLFDPFNVKKGLTAYPNIGAKVFVSSGELVQEYMSRFGLRTGEVAETVHLGHLVSSPETKVKVNLQSIFGRHCAVVGTTGGGKSFTVSKLIESLSLTNNKSVIIDATGEYSNFDKLTNSLQAEIGSSHYFHYSNLSVSDLFVIFRPAGQVQQPLLLEAINSLKLVNILYRDQANFTFSTNGSIDSFVFSGKGGVQLQIDIQDGCLIKGGKSTIPFFRLCAIYIDELNDFNNTNFDIKKLTRQINNECYPVFGENWDSRPDNRNLGNASSLIIRIHQALSDPDFQKVFGFDNKSKKDVIEELIEFTRSTNTNIQIRISFNNVPFSFQIREIVANSIGNILLKLARAGNFDSKRHENNLPLVVLMDEAHQFLNKSVRDEFFESSKLDAFESIAKECRKHGLFLCIATQMPRDIPSGTLSQMGTFIVHRLINHNDKEAVANSCSSANRNTLDFLPILGEGEAILTGVDFPMPIIMKFDKPVIEPNSGTPKLK
jgi:uncharacterized protein